MSFADEPPLHDFPDRAIRKLLEDPGNLRNLLAADRTFGASMRDGSLGHDIEAIPVEPVADAIGRDAGQRDQDGPAVLGLVDVDRRLPYAARMVRGFLRRLLFLQAKELMAQAIRFVQHANRLRPHP